jgi:hypothetical protein
MLETMAKDFLTSPRGCGPIVGSRVTLEPYAIRGILIALVLDSVSEEIAFAVVWFDSGLDHPPLYQPIRWNLLRAGEGGRGYVVHAGDDALTDLPEPLRPDPLHYSHNSSQLLELPPGSQSWHIH